MRKQTKLVAVLSTAALLAIGASMTSFAATGWAEEDGTWVYYNRDGERLTNRYLIRTIVGGQEMEVPIIMTPAEIGRAHV